MKIGVSSCLLGNNVRYNGSNTRNEKLLELIKDEEIIALCPECEAGLPIPRNPIEIQNSRIVDALGNDFTEKLNNASRRILESVKDCDFLVLKSKSPTCGYKTVYDGTFSGRIIEGNGSFTALCLENGIKVFSEQQIEEIKEYLYSNKKP